MQKFAIIEYYNKTNIPSHHNPQPNYQTDDLIPNNSDQELYFGAKTFADVVIEIRDENGKLINGDYALVTYQEFINNVAQPPVTINIPGSIYLVHSQIVIADTSNGNNTSYNAVILSLVDTEETYTPPGTSDAIIKSVRIDKEESSAGARDGQITIEAASSYLPLTYSLDGEHYQDSPTFYGLAGGGYTAYVKDAVVTTLQTYLFNLPTISSLLLSDPTVRLDGFNTSRWNAAFNPITFTYQRRDFAIVNIFPDAKTNKLSITVNQVLTGLKQDDHIFVQAGFINNNHAYQGIYKVENVSISTVVLDTPYIEPGSITGYINADAVKPYYRVETEITYQNKQTGRTETIVATHRPDKFGIVRAELSSFLQSLLQAKDESDFTRINFRDDNLSACYNIRYTEIWYDQQTLKDTERKHISIDKPYYVTYSAKQLGEINGGNMAEYVPFKKTLLKSQRAKWITDFSKPAYSNGYPFDIGFIYSEDIAGLDIFCEITPLDINMSPLPVGVQTSYLLNEDKSFLLNQDGNRLVIARQPVTNQPVTQPIAQRIGLNRLRISTMFTEAVHYFTVVLKYNNTEGSHAITQEQTIRIDNAVDDQSVYLRWIGLKGSWNYYRFVYNQEVTLDVQNAVIVKNHVHDWSEQQGIEEVISKSAGLKMKVMAEDLSVADIKGLQSIKYSPKVQMLINKNPVRWQTVVLNTATFAEFETRNGQAPFSITFNLPALNIQTQ